MSAAVEFVGTAPNINEACPAPLLSSIRISTMVELGPSDIPCDPLLNPDIHKAIIPEVSFGPNIDRWIFGVFRSIPAYGNVLCQIVRQSHESRVESILLLPLERVNHVLILCKFRSLWNVWLQVVQRIGIVDAIRRNTPINQVGGVHVERPKSISRPVGKYILMTLV